MIDSTQKNLQEVQEMEFRKANREKARNDAIACLNPKTTKERDKAERIINEIIIQMDRFNTRSAQPEPVSYGLALSKLFEKAHSFNELLDELRSDLREMSSDQAILDLRKAIDNAIIIIQCKKHKKPGPKYQSHRRELVLRCADALVLFGIKPCFSKESGNVSRLSIALHRMITADGVDVSTIKSECVKVKDLFQKVRFAPEFEVIMQECALQSILYNNYISYTELFNRVRSRQLKRITKVFKVAKRFKYSLPSIQQCRFLAIINRRLKVIYFMKYLSPRRKKIYGVKPKVSAIFKNTVIGVRPRRTNER